MQNVHPMLAGLVLMTACTAPGPKVGSVPTPEQLAGFQATALDPRMMGITVYQSNAGPVFKGANRVHAGYAGHYRMRSSGTAEIPVIRFDTRWQKRITALVDTRSVYSWTDLHTGGQLDFVQLGGRPYAVRPSHVQDTMAATAAYKHALRIGDLRVEDAVLFLRPVFRSLGPLGRGLEPPRPHLVLGLDILGHFDQLTLDYPERRVVLSSKGAYQPDPDKLLAQARFNTSSHGILVKGRLGSYSGSFLIDSGGDYAVSIPPAITPDDRNLWIGDLRFSVPLRYAPPGQYHAAPAYPAIGHRSLRSFKVTFDFKKHRVYFEQPGTD